MFKLTYTNKERKYRRKTVQAAKPGNRHIRNRDPTLYLPGIAGGHWLHPPMFHVRMVNLKFIVHDVNHGM
jgi:hypothetical protein